MVLALEDIHWADPTTLDFIRGVRAALRRGRTGGRAAANGVGTARRGRHSAGAGLAASIDYRFKHALIQDVAYENLLKSRRQVLHRRVGDCAINLLLALRPNRSYWRITLRRRV